MMSSPSKQTISDFFNEGISKIDKKLDFLHSELAKDVSRVVLEYKDNDLTLTYSVRSDCVLIFSTVSE